MVGLSMVVRSHILVCNSWVMTSIVTMHLTTSIITISLLLLSTIFLLLPPSHCEQPVYNSDPVCKEQTYNCGSLRNISYPFWGHNRPQHCGGGNPFKLNCHHNITDDNNNITTIEIGSQDFTVLKINTTSNTMRFIRTDLAHDVCSPQFNDTYLNTSSNNLFRYDPSVYNVAVFYNCSSAADITFGYFNCTYGYAVFAGGVEDELRKEFPWLIQTCGRHTQVPVDVPLRDYRDDRLDVLLATGFPVIYTVTDDHKSMSSLFLYLFNQLEN